MTELEQRLANALEALSKQYESDVRSLSQQVSALSLRLNEQTQQLQGLQQQLLQQTTDREQADKALLLHLRGMLDKQAQSLTAKLTELAES